MTDLHELLKKFNDKLIKVIEGNYSNSELANEVCELRIEIDRRLKLLDEIKYTHYSRSY